MPLQRYRAQFNDISEVKAYILCLRYLAGKAARSMIEGAPLQIDVSPESGLIRGRIQE